MENMLLYYIPEFQFPVLESHMSHVFPFGKSLCFGELLPGPYANEYLLSSDSAITTDSKRVTGQLRGKKKALKKNADGVQKQVPLSSCHLTRGS